MEQTNNNQFVVFTLDNNEYGVDIHSVTTIEKVIPAARVPKTPDYLRGVINLRGDIIPVVDVRKRLSLTNVEETDDTRIIIVKVNETAVGILVDAVDEVLEIDDNSIENMTFLGSENMSEFFSGIGRYQDRIITLLNVEKFVKLTEDDQ